jgi:hypothetical protein
MVYFIQEHRKNGFIKIGKTNDLQERLRALQQGNPHKLNIIVTIPGSFNLEGKIHEDLKAFQHGHEWFNPTDEVLNYIEEIRWIDYDIIDGIPMAILWRETPDSPTDHCPFCGERHRHEEKDGHYEADCARWWLPNEGGSIKRESRDGIILKGNNGYIIRTRNKNHRIYLFSMFP